jgi:hypothetical protein
MVWLTSRDQTAGLEADVDRLLDCLARPRDLLPGDGNLWWALDVPTGDCQRLSIPTTIDALPPFRPASPGSPCGVTAGLDGGSLPEVIASPEDLPDQQRVRPIGQARRPRTLEEFL